MSGVLAKLRQVTDRVTFAERRACEFILDNPEFILENPLNAVAAASEASEATIIRLCRKVDLSGFRELRLAVAQETAIGPSPAIHEDALPEDSEADLLGKVFAAFTSALADTLKVIDIEQFSGAVSALREANSISFFGFGASGATAESAHFRFMRLGKPSFVLTDVSAQLSRVALIGAGDVVVAISHSGRTRELVFAAEQAQQRGARVIAVTQYGRSKLEAIADFVLATSSVETAFRSEVMASRVAQHALLDALFVAVALPDSKHVIAAIDEHHRLIQALQEN